VKNLLAVDWNSNPLRIQVAEGRKIPSRNPIPYPLHSILNNSFNMQYNTYKWHKFSIKINFIKTYTMLEFFTYNFINIYLCNFVWIYHNAENRKNAELSYCFIFILERYGNYYIWNRNPAKTKRSRPVEGYTAFSTAASSTRNHKRNSDICT
jgi:hypothetical protein